jgi:hypothetical protein
MHKHVKELAIAQAIEQWEAFDTLGPLYLDKVVEVVIDRNEARAIVKHGDKEMTVSEYTGHLRNVEGVKPHDSASRDIARQFEAGVKSGGGTRPGNSGNGPKNQTSDLRRGGNEHQRQGCLYQKER